MNNHGKKIRKKRNSKIPGVSIFRKEFYRRLLYIGLCIIPMYIFGNDTGTFRLVPLPFFLFGMYQLLMIVVLSPHIIDDFFPPRVGFEKVAKPINKFIYYFSSSLFFIGIIALLFELKNLDNTIHGTKLFWMGGAIGVLLAIISTVLLKITNPSVYFESKRRYTVYFGLFVGLFFLTSSAAGFVNHHYASKSKTCEKHTILRKGSGGRRSKEYYIHIMLKDKSEERFSIKRSLYEKLNEGEEIEFCVQKGKLGFDFVKDINKIEW